MKINIKYLDHYPIELGPPAYATDGTAGMDLFACNVRPIDIYVRMSVKFNLGFCLEVPVGYEMQLRARSGLSTKHGLMLPNGIGTIDSDYRDEVSLVLCRPVPGLDDKIHVTINRGDRIGQMVLKKIDRITELNPVEALSETLRNGGFGSTGR